MSKKVTVPRSWPQGLAQTERTDRIRLPYRCVGGQERSRYAARRRFPCHAVPGLGGHPFNRNDGNAPSHLGGEQGGKTGPGNRRYALHVLSGQRGTGANQCGPCYEAGQSGRGKTEGGARVVPQVRAMVQAGIPVQGHLGLTPQSAAQFGGFKVQGKTAEAARVLIEDAQALAEAGCFSIASEAIPSSIAEMITEAVPIPIIGIGAGPSCEGRCW